MAQDTRQRWNLEEKCERKAWYWRSSGGKIDQDMEVAMGVDW
jgi:hypothetical protein